MVLAKLAGGIAEWLEQFGDRRVPSLQSNSRGGNAYFGKPGAERALAGDEGRTPSGAALLGVIVGEHHSFAADAVDIRRPIAHQTERIGADIGLADIIAEDDEDVRLATRRRRLSLRGLDRSLQCRCGCTCGPGEENAAPIHSSALLAPILLRL